MPKISKQHIRVNHPAGDRYFDIEIMYNQEHMFHAAIPDVFDIQFDHMKDKERKKYLAKKIHKFKYNNGPFKRSVVADTEAKCITAARELMEHLLTTVVETRRVIIILYDGEDLVNYHGMEENDQHPQIGFRFSLSYCEETTVPGGKKMYNIVRLQPVDWQEPDGKKEEIRQKVDVYDSKCTIIDDTTQARAFLENLYKNLHHLQEQMDKFTKTPQALLGLISSNQKLIN